MPSPWAFTENIEDAICSLQKSPHPAKRIVIDVGADHATRVADFLRQDGFVSDSNLRFLRAIAFDQKTIVPELSSKVNHISKLNEHFGYKEECNNYSPTPHLSGSGSAPQEGLRPSSK